MKTSTLPKYRCAIIDDDRMTVDILKNYISKISKIETIHAFTDPLQALSQISENDLIDFLFLDIRMDISGIDVAKVLRNKVKFLIFVTSYKEYALDAFSVDCDKYLVKPVLFPDFLNAINEIIIKDKKQSRKPVK
ncbi:LytR/AlgR family response regulator transcription factor [Pedobacter fastidiosus]|uniref:Response regulator n=1 Tax=Pedobacter fastidiosus TaxID=2765361 RepID=A0ABR7KX61_9SPHI|nr:response regulator [Pedobacter fastidiosus]MBC6112603.1 response regulator [Pedobacter fastidiosus]